MTLEELKHKTYTSSLMLGAFIEVCQECVGNTDFVKEWNRLSGYSLGVVRAPIAIAIDKACSYSPDEAAMPDFTDFVFEYIWFPLYAEHGDKLINGQ